MAFYNPVTLTNRNTALIVYPEIGVESLLEEESVGFNSQKLIGTGQGIGPAGRMVADWRGMSYMIGFLWGNEGELYLDLWKMKLGWDSGPLAFSYLFKAGDTRVQDSQDRIKKMGNGSGNTLLVLAEEEKIRRRLELDLGLSGAELIDEYSKDKYRPQLPFDLGSGKVLN